MRQYPLVCGNVKCKTSQTPLWRKGWTTKEGKPVMLCNACGLHYKKGHFCIYCNQIYKESDADDKEEPWIGCDSCHRWVHQNCERTNGFEIKPNGYLCPCCRNQPKNGSIASNIPAAALTAAANKHYEPILMKPGTGASSASKSANNSNSKENKKRRRKPTLEPSASNNGMSKKVKHHQQATQQISSKLHQPQHGLTIDTKLVVPQSSVISRNNQINSQLSSSNNSSNRLSTPTSAISMCLSPSTTLGLPSSNSSTNLVNRSSAPSTSTSCFESSSSLSGNKQSTSGSGSLYDVDSFYKENESQCFSPTATSKLSLSSDDEYSYESNSEDGEEEGYESDAVDNTMFVCGEDFVDDRQEFIIWDPLNDKKSTVGVSYEEVESMITKSFGYSTLLTRKIQSLSAICACELSNLDL